MLNRIRSYPQTIFRGPCVISELETDLVISLSTDLHIQFTIKENTDLHIQFTIKENSSDGKRQVSSVCMVIAQIEQVGRN